MSDYCAQCTITVLGIDGEKNDYRNIGACDPVDLAPGEGYPVLCEGCGPTLVDKTGNCLLECPGGKLHDEGEDE